MELNERIASIRTALGETQDEFGARFGVSRKSVIRWERATLTIKYPKRLVEWLVTLHICETCNGTGYRFSAKDVRGDTTVRPKEPPVES